MNKFTNLIVQLFKGASKACDALYLLAKNFYIIIFLAALIYALVKIIF